MSPRKSRDFAAEAQNLLFHYNWPGNVRELANAVEYAVNMESSPFVQADNLPKQVREGVKDWSSTEPLQMKGQEMNLKKLERHAIIQALERVTREKKRKDKAARLLGISRATLFRKLNEYNLT